jgi:hypothetical protein
MTGFEAWMAGLPIPPLTREQRLAAYYQTFAGPYPGPNRSAVAAILAFRAVDIEDKGDVQNLNT